MVSTLIFSPRRLWRPLRSRHQHGLAIWARADDDDRCRRPCQVFRQPAAAETAGHRACRDVHSAALRPPIRPRHRAAGFVLPATDVLRVRRVPPAAATLATISGSHRASSKSSRTATSARLAGCGISALSRRERGPQGPGPLVGGRPGQTSIRIVLLEGKAQRLERLARALGVARGEHQRPSVSSAMPTIAPC